MVKRGPEFDTVLRRCFAMGLPKATWYGSIMLESELLQPWHAQYPSPQVYITLILLVSFLQPDPLGDHFQVLDFYAGKGRLARGARYVGMPAAAVDVMYTENNRAMDMNSPSGFVLPASHTILPFNVAAGTMLVVSCLFDYG